MENIILAYGKEMEKFSFKKLGSSLGEITLSFTFNHSDDKTEFTIIS